MELRTPIPSPQLRFPLPISPPFLLLTNSPRRFCLRRRSRPPPSAAATDRNLDASWIPVDGSSNDGFGGWSVTVTRPAEDDRHAAIVSRFVIAGAGATVAVLLATFAWCSYSRKCFKLQLDAPFHTLCKLILPSKRIKEPGKDTESPVLAVEQDEEVDMVSDGPKLKEDGIVSGIPVVLSENKRVIVPVAPDSTQEEALILLKKLKIIEHDTAAGELCTRREYARWLVKTNSLLERNPKYRISPLGSLDSSLALAFDDVSTNDPDFRCIQALGEAGIVLSKLSVENSGSFSDMSKIDDQGKFEFRPDSFITRFDLVNWKALLEYSYTSKVDDKMLRKKEGFLDLDAIVRNASPQLLTDLMAGDSSITRRVFACENFARMAQECNGPCACTRLTSRYRARVSVSQ